MSGRFITIEGGEGSGKSSQALSLAKRLSAAGIDVVRTREPGGSPFAETLRDIILSGAVKSAGPKVEALLFAAARVDHLTTTIRPALARGDWVVSDRFADSTRAYQGAAGAISPGWIRALEDLTVGLGWPDLTIVLDVPVEVGLARAAARRRGVGADRFEAEGATFHEALRRAFTGIAVAEPDRCVLIDASRTQAEVEADVWGLVARRFGVREMAA